MFTPFENTFSYFLSNEHDPGTCASLSVPVRPDLLVLEAVAEDVVHVLVQPLQAPVARPHIGVVGGHQPLYRGLQAGQQLPMFPPGEREEKKEGGEKEKGESGTDLTQPVFHTNTHREQIC